MDKLKIKRYLKLLGIDSLKSLESNDIDYWWILKFKQIQSDKNASQEDKEKNLVNINNARDELSEIDIDKLKKILLNNNSKKKNTKNKGSREREEEEDYKANSYRSNKYQ